jgi:hypothetical protein
MKERFTIMQDARKRVRREVIARLKEHELDDVVVDTLTKKNEEVMDANIETLKKQIMETQDELTKAEVVDTSSNEFLLEVERERKGPSR